MTRIQKLGIGALAVLLTVVIILATNQATPTVAPAPTTTSDTSGEPVTSANSLAVKQFASGFSSPTVITANAIDDRVFVAERSGKIFSLTGENATPELFVDLSSRVKANNEQGLLGLALHPNLATDRRMFVNYIDKSENTVISSILLDETLQKADLSTEKILLRFAQPFDNHNGGDLKFGPDGYLYIASGDGGSSGDPNNRSQNLNTLLGKLLRIDVNGTDTYKIPADNPFVGVEGAREEIWALGLRNPWKFSFDRATDDLWIADVGQGDWEEVNFVPSPLKSGLNFGWRCYEGQEAYNLNSCLDKDQYQLPIINYDHNNGKCSVTGGSVYRGESEPGLVGRYFYADFCSGQIFAGKQLDNTWTAELELDTEYKIAAFGETKAGELLFADFSSGSLFQILAGD